MRGTTGRCRATRGSRKRGHSPLTVSALIWGSPLERRSFSRSRSRRSWERDLGERRRRSRERERERRCRERREREPDRERLLLGDLWGPEPPCSEPDTRPQLYNTPRAPSARERVNLGHTKNFPSCTDFVLKLTIKTASTSTQGKLHLHQRGKCSLVYKEMAKNDYK